MRILIIGPSWVGVSVMAQTLYKSLKKEEPNCTIDVISPSWTQPIIQRMPEISESISSPFLHGDIKILSRYKFGKSLQKAGYERSITLANSLKSSLIPFFAKIPTRTGWLGEMRYGLLNDIRKLEPKRNYLMIEKFALLSSQETEISLEGDLLETIKNFFMASNGYVSYAGTFNADDSNVYHNIELSLLPQWLARL